MIDMTAVVEIELIHYHAESNGFQWIFNNSFLLVGMVYKISVAQIVFLYSINILKSKFDQ